MIVDYTFFQDGQQWPPTLPACLYQYVVGQNGVFVRAWRRGLSACIWSSAFSEPIRGLGIVEPHVHVPEKVPARFLIEILARSQEAAPNEILFYLEYRPDLDRISPWKGVIPHQVRSPGGVRPVDPFNPNAKDALIEVHSHHSMSAFFSKTDDRDETGFRVYAVLGRVKEQPEISVRIGIYGHFWQIPASWIFEMPAAIQNVLSFPTESHDDYHVDFVVNFAQ
jgi:PRTRC genetic system protein A